VDSFSAILLIIVHVMKLLVVAALVLAVPGFQPAVWFAWAVVAWVRCMRPCRYPWDELCLSRIPGPFPGQAVALTVT
jgi:hypothetical protein